jgi:phosphoglycolate phosphatase
MLGFDCVGIHWRAVRNVARPDDGLAGTASIADWWNQLSYCVVYYWVCFICGNPYLDYAQQGLMPILNSVSVAANEYQTGGRHRKPKSRSGERERLERMTNPKITAAVFDFDYTLADSSKGCVECVNFALQEMGLATHPVENICRTIGLSLKETFVRLAGNEDAAQGDQFARLFVQRADQVMVDLTVVYQSVAATIHALQEGGLRLGIVSTKYRYRIEQVLERENLRQFFEVVIGGEDVAEHKPHPAGLLEAIRRFESSPLSTVYVGDSLVDAEVAKRAGVPFVAVLSGVTPVDHFEGFERVGTLKDISELPRLLGGNHHPPA